MENKYYLGIEGELKKVTQKYPVKIGFVGCGSHSYRNILTALHFLPVEIVAFSDLNIEKAKKYAQHFGAQAYYKDFKKMIDKENLDAVITVVGYSHMGEPLYFPIVKYVLTHGLPVWFEKPPSRNAVELKKLKALEKKGVSFGQVGFKKMFMPTIKKAKEIINSKKFGNITSYYFRYPVDLPVDIRDIEAADGRRFIDDFVHIASALYALVGKPDQLLYKRTTSGNAFVILLHKEGYIGSIHLCPGASEMCPLETIEVIGEGSNIIIRNNIDLEYYPKSERLPYGTTTEFLPSNKNGASHYTPEFSLGQLYNKGLFLLGYYHELKHFVVSVANKKRPTIANLDDAISIMEIYDALSGKEGELVDLGKNVRLGKLSKKSSKNKVYICPNCGGNMYLKDGWNFKCEKCGKMVAASKLEG